MGASPHVHPSSAGADATPAPARLGRFELIERIGVGGMAEVFRAAVTGPEGFRRELVVKRILPELSARPKFTQMFVNEAKISALLAHPNIVQIFEFGESDGAYFIAMESVRGITVRQALIKLREQDRVMPVVTAAEIAREVLMGLDYAHSQRDADGRPLEIVHRDISPSNIMLADTGAVKILDFGIARAADLMADDEGHVVKGKIAYLAPEQITCEDIDARVDVFAMGCVLHEVLTGRVMFRAQNDLERKISLLAEVTAPPSSWNPEVPPALDLIVARATARDRNARYTSAADMLTDVENYLSSFRSSSRVVKRLVRSLSEDSQDGDSAQPAAPGTGPHTADRGGVPAAMSPTGGTRPTRLPERDSVVGQAPRVGTSPRADDGYESVVGDSTPEALPAGAIGKFGVVWRSRLTWLKRLPVSRWLVRIGSVGFARMPRIILRRKVSTMWALVLGACVLAGVVLGARALWRRGPKTSVGIAAARANTETSVWVTFRSTPPGAWIVDARGRTIGTTPATISLTQAHAAIPFRFEKDGFRAGTSSVVPDAEKTIVVDLRPVRRVEKPVRKVPIAKHTMRRR